jgi:hypothetical protein
MRCSLEKLEWQQGVGNKSVVDIVVVLINRVNEVVVECGKGVNK